MEHFKEICKECKKVITQCRCPSKDKKITYSLCDECKDVNYNFKREIGIKILEQIDEWTDDHGLETSADMEMELVQRVEAILKEKGIIK